MAKHAAASSKIPLASLKISPLRHEAFPPEIAARILLVKHALKEVHPLSAKAWMEGFQRDAHPTREIEIWESLASKYTSVLDHTDLALTEKKELFSVLLTASVGNLNAFDPLSHWHPTKLQAVFEGIRPHPEYFEHEETAEPSASPPMLNDLDAFSGDEAMLDTQYLEQLAKMIAAKEA